MDLHSSSKLLQNEHGLKHKVTIGIVHDSTMLSFNYFQFLKSIREQVFFLKSVCTFFLFPSVLCAFWFPDAI